MVHLQNTNFGIRYGIMTIRKKNKWHYELHNKGRDMKIAFKGYLGFFSLFLLASAASLCVESTVALLV